MKAARFRSEEGSIMPMIIGFAALLLGVVVVITAATALYIERKQLLTVADAAALVGSESFPLDAASGGRSGTLLHPNQVRAEVLGYLDRIDLSGFEQFRLVEAGTLDSTTATVTLSAGWRPPILGWFLSEGITVEVTSTARSVFN